MNLNTPFLAGMKRKDAEAQAIVEGIEFDKNTQFVVEPPDTTENAGIISHYPPIKGLSDEDQHSLKIWKNTDRWRNVPKFNLE